MKKIFFTSLIILLSISLFAQKPRVIATASMIADMAKNIAGDELEIQCIVPIGGDPHIYEPKPSDAKMVADGQLILMNGLTFEGWLNELIENSGTKAKTIRVTKDIKPIESETYKNSADPHAWMDAALGLTYIKNIYEAFAELEPSKKPIFERNYLAYKAKLTELDNYILEAIKTIPENNRILITSHDAFQYYGRKYGIQLESILGTSTDAEAQTSDITNLTKVIQKYKVPAVFVESTINPKMLQQIAKDNGVKIGGSLFADSVGNPDKPEGSYYGMLKYNTDVIVNALKADASSNAMKDQTDTKDAGTSTYIMYGLLALLFIGGFGFVFSRLNK